MQQYGIRITIPSSSTMTKDHLLGKDWESFRWYSSKEARDHAYEDMMSQPYNYRQGDTIQQVLEKVERSGTPA
jgi:uncharacterized protein YbaA (DUF1428 family)